MEGDHDTGSLGERITSWRDRAGKRMFKEGRGNGCGVAEGRETLDWRRLTGLRIVDCKDEPIG
jgi:hypothetical protein